MMTQVQTPKVSGDLALRDRADGGQRALFFCLCKAVHGMAWPSSWVDNTPQEAFSNLALVRALRLELLSFAILSKASERQEITCLGQHHV